MVYAFDRKSQPRICIEMRSFCAHFQCTLRGPSAITSVMLSSASLQCNYPPHHPSITAFFWCAAFNQWILSFFMRARRKAVNGARRILFSAPKGVFHQQRITPCALGLFMRAKSLMHMRDALFERPLKKYAELQLLCLGVIYLAVVWHGALQFKC